MSLRELSAPRDKRGVPRTLGTSQRTNACACACRGAPVGSLVVLMRCSGRVTPEDREGIAIYVHSRHEKPASPRVYVHRGKTRSVQGLLAGWGGHLPLPRPCASHDPGSKAGRQGRGSVPILGAKQASV